MLAEQMPQSDCRVYLNNSVSKEQEEQNRNFQISGISEVGIDEAEHIRHMLEYVEIGVNAYGGYGYYDAEHRPEQGNQQLACDIFPLLHRERKHQVSLIAQQVFVKPLDYHHQRDDHDASHQYKIGDRDNKACDGLNI